MLVSFLISAEIEIGRYQLAVSTYTSKKGTVYIIETVIDTKSGDIVKRKKIKASSYKLPYRDGYNKMVYKDKLKK